MNSLGMLGLFAFRIKSREEILKIVILCRADRDALRDVVPRYGKLYVIKRQNARFCATNVRARTFLVFTYMPKKGGFMRRIVFLVIVMLTLAFPAWAEVIWQQTGDLGKPVYVLAIDPTNSQNIFAGTNGDGVFKSNDGGKSWSNSSNGLTPDAIWVLKLAIDPTNSQIIYAGTTYSGGVYKSIDGGSTWSPAKNGLPFASITAMAIDPSNSQNIFVGVNWYGGVWKSTNGAASWQEASNGMSLTKPTSALVVNPTNGLVVYAGTDGSSQLGVPGVFKTIDGGSSWSAPNNQFSSRQISTIVIDPTNSQTLYVGLWYGGVWKSIDGGDSWFSVNNGALPPLAYVGPVVIDPKNHQTLYVGTNDCVYKTTDGGASWNVFNTGINGLWVWSLAIDPTNPQRIFAGTETGQVFATVNVTGVTPPTSLTVPSSDADGSYTVAWGKSKTAGVTYVLEEATDSKFIAGLRVAYEGGAALSTSISGRIAGSTYYYRVKAVKVGYADSSWKTARTGCFIGTKPPKGGK